LGGREETRYWLFDTDEALSVDEVASFPSFFPAVPSQTLACSPTSVRVAGLVHPCGWQESETRR
jgi:hypothetical protein